MPNIPKSPPGWVLSRMQNLTYDPETGFVTWATPPGRRYKAGERIGTLFVDRSGHKYRRIHFQNREINSSISVLEHNVCYYLFVGKWPTSTLDHANRDGTDNRWINLRQATPSQQTINTRLRSDNKTGARGVSWCTAQARYQAQIMIRGKSIHLGYYDDVASAAIAYKQGALKFHDPEFRHPSIS